MGALFSTFKQRGRWWHTPLGLALLVCLQRANRHNLLGVSLWIAFHLSIRLPVMMALRRLLKLFHRVNSSIPAPPPFGFIPQAFLDCTLHSKEALPLHRQQLLFQALAWLACALVRTKPVHVQSSKYPLLNSSWWLGADIDLTPSTCVLLYAHGGGFTLGEPRMWAVGQQQICDAALGHGVAMRVLSVEYPLAMRSATNGFQLIIDRLVMAFDFLVEAGVAPHSIVIAGDSAGGNLAISACKALRDRVWRQHHPVRPSSDAVRASLPAAALLISPWTDLSSTAHWRTRHNPDDEHFLHTNIDYVDLVVLERLQVLYVANSRRYADQHTHTSSHNTDPPSASQTPVGPLDATESVSASHPLISPIHGDLSCLPPVHLSWGAWEMLAPDCADFAAALRHAGNDVSQLVHPDTTHNFMLLPYVFGSKMTQPSMDAACAFLCQQIKRARARVQAQQAKEKECDARAEHVHVRTDTPPPAGATHVQLPT